MSFDYEPVKKIKEFGKRKHLSLGDTMWAIVEFFFSNEDKISAIDGRFIWEEKGVHDKLEVKEEDK